MGNSKGVENLGLGVLIGKEEPKSPSIQLNSKKRGTIFSYLKRSNPLVAA